MKIGDLVRHVNNGDFYTIISMDEFDYVLVSLIESYKDKSVRTDLNKWNFSFVQIK